jgi:hypothetical protein
MNWRIGFRLNESSRNESSVPLQWVVNEGPNILSSAETTSTYVNWLGGQFLRLYLRQRVIFEDASTLARLAGCLVKFLLSLFATDSLTAQTPDPSPTDAPQPEVRPPLSPFPGIKIGAFYETRPNELILTTD